MRSISSAIRDLNDDPTVDGIIVQMPLPPSIRLRAIVDCIDPAKDIDGIHPLNAGLLRLGYDGFLPATAHAAVEILRRSGIEIAGQDATVVGRSAVVGMPAAFLLVREDATVTVCHRRTRDLAGHVRRADIVIVAAGRPGLITGEMLKPGAVGRDTCAEPPSAAAFSNAVPCTVIRDRLRPVIRTAVEIRTVIGSIFFSHARSIIVTSIICVTSSDASLRRRIRQRSYV